VEIVLHSVLPEFLHVMEFVVDRAKFVIMDFANLVQTTVKLVVANVVHLILSA